MKRIKTQTINVDLQLWNEAKTFALKNHNDSVSSVISKLLDAWNASHNKHITIKTGHLRSSTKVRRSLYCERHVWQEAKSNAKEHFGKSGSYIINILLQNWVIDERKRKIENPNQATLL